MDGKAKKSVHGHSSKITRSKMTEDAKVDPCGNGIGHQFQLLMEPFAKYCDKNISGGKDFHKMYAIFVCVRCGAGLEVGIDMVSKEPK
jgi:hypothetical protein